MINEQEYLNIIKETFTEIQIDNFEILGKGLYGVACLVNDNIVFKIPIEHHEKRNNIKKEIFLLKQLENKLSFEIPRVLYNKESERGIIIGETLVPGITYSQELHDSFDPETKSDILRQLGKIARELHGVKITDKESVLFVADYKDSISAFHKYFSTDVQKCFSEADIKLINAICDRYEYLSTHYPVTNVVVHADLHFGNLMFDTEKNKIIGLIDFGAAHFAEPSRDMHYYYGDGAKDFLDGYGDNSDIYLPERQKFQAVVNFLSNIGKDIKYNNSPEKNINKLLGIL
ncbi:MAG: aminoglycoside phosphotransferase family protein [Alphaproteobacteria bacterium]|nr:aminoglycoside phosphotransferase family protein [Alphaproteobacteria bacterium]